ncbi:hypothetical protein OQA88_11757 [Cercophora sp. LCS_1]
MAPSALLDMDTSVIPDSQNSSEKKHKRDKPERKKKRARDDDEAAAVEETPRKPKKSKSEIHDADDTAMNSEPTAPSAAGESKHKKKKRRDHEQDEQKKKKKDKKDKAVASEEALEERTEENSVAAADLSSRKKSKKERKHQTAEEERVDGIEVEPAEDLAVKELGDKKKHKEKKSKKRRSEVEVAQEDLIEIETAEPAAPEKEKKRKGKSKKEKKAASPDPFDAMDVDAPSTPAKKHNKDFPFFTQSVSLYVPFFPIGFDKPLTNVAAQHLDPLLNHYSPTLRGVLLSYSNLNLSDRPVKASTINPPTDETPALLHSVDEYAVGFGWLTFDAHLFVPARGKWMEGVVQIQNEGHIGVVCWNKFNASIEAWRLPRGWKWVDDATEKSGKASKTGLPSPDSDEETATRRSDDALDGEELQVVEQMHTTGYWVDEHGKKIGGKLRFRVKNFDVGLAGDYGYLSIEGTFLGDEAERALVAEERDKEKRRRKGQNPNGLLRPMSRRVPEFSMTKLGREDQEEDSGQRAVVYKGSRPGTPDD